MPVVRFARLLCAAGRPGSAWHAGSSGACVFVRFHSRLSFNRPSQAWGGCRTLARDLHREAQGRSRQVSTVRVRQHNQGFRPAALGRQVFV